MWLNIHLLILLPSLEIAGDHLFNTGKYQEAVGIYRKSYKESPSTDIKLRIGMSLYALQDYSGSEEYLMDDPRGTFTLGKMYFKQKNFELAKQFFNEAQEYSYWLGVIALKEGDFEEALKWFKLSKNKYGVGFVNYELGEKELARQSFQDMDNFYALGVLNYQENKLEDALRCFKIGNDVYGIGASFYRMKNYKEALSCFEETETLFFAAECAYGLNRFKTAESYYQKTLAKGVWVRDALYGLAWAYYKLDKFSSSIETFDAFANQYWDDPLRVTSMYRAARVLLKIGMLESLVERFKRVIKEYPESDFVDDCYYWVGKTYFITGDYEACTQELKTLLLVSPKSNLRFYTYSMLGDAHYKQSKYASAVEWYEKIEEPLTLLDDARFKIEECYFRLGRYTSRLDVLSNFIRKYPLSPRAPKLGLELAHYWFKQNNFTNAIEAYNKVITDFSWSVAVDEAKLGLAECYFRLGKYEDAIAVYRELLSTSSGMKAQFSLANTYFLIDNYNKAIHEYEVLINEYPNSDFAKDAQYQIGLLYLSLKKPKEARIAFLEFTEICLEDPRYWNAQLEIAKTHYEEGNIKEYEEILIYIENKGKGNPSYEAVFLLGTLYFDREEYETAKEYYLQAANGYKETDAKSRALLATARCAKILKEFDEARKLYEEVISLAPNPVLVKEAKNDLDSLGE